MFVKLGSNFTKVFAIRQDFNECSNILAKNRILKQKLVNKCLNFRSVEYENFAKQIKGSFGNVPWSDLCRLIERNFKNCIQVWSRESRP